jgi:hypothetical protein
MVAVPFEAFRESASSDCFDRLAKRLPLPEQPLPLVLAQRVLLLF